MRQDYQKWLSEQQYADNTQVVQINRVKKVEECYGNFDDHFRNGTYENVINDLTYSTNDENAKKPNPSKIKFVGNTRNNLQSYKSAVVRYKKFLNDAGYSLAASKIEPSEENFDTPSTEESIQQRFTLERDMQAALRLNICSLDPHLKIIDDGAERAVNSGFIDITCDDGNSLVVVELKAGKADSRAIGQILGYMGDLQEEEGGKTVCGILVAQEFDKRTKAAARVVPALSLKKYSIEFKFTQED
ncbi:endonuclease NucS domain-containing protein [Chlorobium sp.]|uniref:endonuclease NucS domain-containing protein n=1 Tax=Chlorobium sp. TaxID=1095 RepID=UPI003C571D96